MKLKDKHRNMWTGTWVVCVVLLAIILLPFVLPLVTAVFSLILTGIIGGAMIWGIIIALTALGSVINNHKTGERAKIFNKEQVADGKKVWQKTRDTIGDWLWLAGTKLRSKGEERKDEE